MRLYPGKIPAISQDLIHKLREDGDIDVSNIAEAQLDVEAVLKEYLRMDRELTERAKDLMEQRKLPYSQFARTKRTLVAEVLVQVPSFLGLLAAGVLSTPHMTYSQPRRRGVP